MALTVHDVTRISIQELRKGYYIIPFSKAGGTFRASEDNPELLIESDLRDIENPILKISWLNDEEEFCSTDVVLRFREMKLKNDVKNIYFHCPLTGSFSKTLYLDPDTNLFISRDAYKERLYYPSQLVPKSERLNYRLQKTDDYLLALLLRVKKIHYNEKPTAIRKKIGNLTRKKDLLGRLLVEHYTNRLNKL